MRQSAGVFDICHMAEFRVFGFGAFDFLQRLFTNDLERISELGPGAVHPHARRGRRHHRRPDRLPHRRPRVPDHRQRVEPRDRLRRGSSAHAPADLELVDESDRTGLIALQGPKALGSSTELADEGWEPPARFHIAEACSTRCPRSSRAPATPARTASSSSSAPPTRPALARAALVPRGHAGRARRSRHAAPRDGLPPVRPGHGPDHRPDLGGAGLGRAEGQDGLHRCGAVARVREAKPDREARRTACRRGHPAARVSPCCTGAKRSVR